MWNPDRTTGNQQSGWGRQTIETRLRSTTNDVSQATLETNSPQAQSNSSTTRLQGCLCPLPRQPAGFALADSVIWNLRSFSSRHNIALFPFRHGNLRKFEPSAGACVRTLELYRILAPMRVIGLERQCPTNSRNPIWERERDNRIQSVQYRSLHRREETECVGSRGSLQMQSETAVQFASARLAPMYQARVRARKR